MQNFSFLIQNSSFILTCTRTYGPTPAPNWPKISPKIDQSQAKFSSKSAQNQPEMSVQIDQNPLQIPPGRSGSAPGRARTCAGSKMFQKSSFFKAKSSFFQGMNLHFSRGESFHFSFLCRADHVKRLQNSSFLMQHFSVLTQFLAFLKVLRIFTPLPCGPPGRASSTHLRFNRSNSDQNRPNSDQNKPNSDQNRPNSDRNRPNSVRNRPTMMDFILQMSDVILR